MTVADWLGLLAFGLASSPIPLAIYYQRRHRDRLFRGFFSAARELGLVATQKAPTIVLASGPLGPFALTIQTSRFGADGSPVPSTSWELDGLSTFPPNVTIRARSSSSHSGLGDPELDRHVSVIGPEDLVLAIFTPDVRALVRRAVETGVTVGEGKVIFTQEGLVHDPKTLVEVARRLAQVASALSTPLDLPEALWSRCQTEVTTEVVKRLAKSLLLKHAGSPPARHAVDWAANHPIPILRLYAATQDPDKGLGLFEQIARDPSQPTEMRGFAFERLILGCSMDALRPWVQTGLGDDAMLVYVLTALLERAQTGIKRAELEPLLIDLAGRFDPTGKEGPGLPAGELLIALCALWGADADGILVPLLDRGDPELALAAVGVLAQQGGQRAAGELAVRLKDRVLPERVKLAYARALAEIRTRLVPHLGALSVASDPHQGTLSLTDQDGALSQVPPETK